MPVNGFVTCPPKEVTIMSEKSIIPPDAMRCFKVSSYKETAKILDEATRKTLEQVKVWDATGAQHRKAGGQA